MFGPFTGSQAVEQMAMRQQRVRAARVGVLAACVLGLAVSAFAQAAPPAPQAPAGPVQRLSMEDAIKLALENNLSLQVERMNPELSDLAIEQAKTAWTPNLTAAMNNNSRTSPISGFFSGATDKLTNESFSANVGANQLLPWGANYNVTWDTSRTEVQQHLLQPEPGQRPPT